jgi:hypothetical protein
LSLNPQITKYAIGKIEALRPYLINYPILNGFSWGLKYFGRQISCSIFSLGYPVFLHKEQPIINIDDT